MAKDKSIRRMSEGEEGYIKVHDILEESQGQRLLVYPDAVVRATRGQKYNVRIRYEPGRYILYATEFVSRGGKFKKAPSRSILPIGLNVDRV